MTAITLAGFILTAVVVAVFLVWTFREVRRIDQVMADVDRDLRRRREDDG